MDSMDQNQDAKNNLKNVMVVALADGALADGERKFIESLRQEFQIDAEEFQQLCADVRKNPKRVTLPRDAEEGTAAIRLAVAAAAADGTVQFQEQRLLQRMADYVGIPSQEIDRMLDEALGVSADEADRLEAAMDEIYLHFHSWTDEQLQEKIDALVARGRVAVIPLLRILESYRTPDGAGSALPVKTRVARALGRIGDPRAAYYLTQQVNIGDADDEISDTALRFAAAEAVGKIIHMPFAADQDGVVAVRAWWMSEAARAYDRLAF